jgi:molecular chaperone IbpA
MASGIQMSNKGDWPHEYTKYPKGLPEPLKLPSLHQVLSDQFFLGFQDQISRWNGLTNMKVTTFPPYNLIKTDDDHYVVELALAGYTKDDIEVVVEKDVLTVRSIEKDEAKDAEVLHQGIAKRLWTQKFVLGEWMQVKDAALKDGLLTIKIEREVPEEMKPKTIKIK